MITTRNQAVAYLDSLIGSGIRPGLDRMKQLLEEAGNPERSVPAILIAGTNGKGSTAATLSAILRAAGYRTGLYTSPHLVDLEERWRIDEAAVTSESFVAAVGRLEQCATAVGFLPTYFEALTLLAFFIFEENSCDLSVLEVGMGGRLDATNVAEPVLSIITRIDYDHQEWLGNTIEEIAREKLGIARRGVPLVVSGQPDEVEVLMGQKCRELGCFMHLVSEETRIDTFRTAVGGSAFSLSTPRGHYTLKSPLVGHHQAENVSTAVRAAEILTERFPQIDEQAIVEGTGSTIWRGRLESFDVAGRLVIVDGAHNPAGTKSAADFIASLPGPRALVFGALSDKDIAAMLLSLEGLFVRVFLTAPDSDRSAAPESLIGSVGCENVQVVSDSTEAITLALAAPGMTTVVICGSLYLAGSAIRLLDAMATPSA